MPLNLCEEDASAIIREYDGAFDQLEGLEELSRSRVGAGSSSTYGSVYQYQYQSYCSPVKNYVATYTGTPPPSSPLKQHPDRDLPTTRTGRILISISTSPTSLTTLITLHDAIQKHTPIPLIPLLKRDDSGGVVAGVCYALYAFPNGVPFNWLYSDHDTGNLSNKRPLYSAASSHGFHSYSTPSPNFNLSPKDKLFLRLKTELKLGALFKELHDKAQNDYFGLPWTITGNESGIEEEGWEECFSWQEGFTRLVEEALANVERLLAEKPRRKGNQTDMPGQEEEIPTKTIHRLLSRSIGSFLFDDVEVPSLIFCPFGDWTGRVFIAPTSSAPTVSLSSSGEGIKGEKGTGEVDADVDVEITAIVGWEQSLWGDPLMDGIFSPSLLQSSSSSSPPKTEWPSKPFLEGYQSNPIILPRHRTKRLWYDLYAVLGGLVGFLSGRIPIESRGEGEGKNGGEKEGAEQDEEERRILKEIRDIVKTLEDAPCY